MEVKRRGGGAELKEGVLLQIRALRPKAAIPPLA
jgi:hypothetical protein